MGQVQKTGVKDSPPRRDYTNVMSQLVLSEWTRIRRGKSMLDIGKALFPIQQMPVGALPIYDKDPGVADIVTESQALDSQRSH